MAVEEEELRRKARAAVRDYAVFLAEQSLEAPSPEEFEKTFKRESRRFVTCVSSAAKNPESDVLCCPQSEDAQYRARCGELSSNAHRAFAELLAAVGDDAYGAFVNKFLKERPLRKWLLRATAAVAAGATLIFLLAAKKRWKAKSFLQGPSSEAAEEGGKEAQTALRFLAKLGITPKKAASLLEEAEAGSLRPTERTYHHAKKQAFAVFVPAPLQLFYGYKNAKADKRWHDENQLRGFLHSDWDASKHRRYKVLPFVPPLDG
jgi:hypothetical protein